MTEYPGGLPAYLGTSGCMLVEVGCMLHLGGKAQIVLVEIPGRAASVRRPEPDVTSASSTLPASPTTDRLSLKQESATTGVVDGAWWPASRDLAAEMPAFIAALADRAGAVERVSYNIDAWDAVPRKVRVDGNVVRMGGFRSQAAATLKVVGERRVLTLLVVPPETDEQPARRVLAAASENGNTEGIDALLATAAN
jgi:hypothetical protein